MSLRTAEPLPGPAPTARTRSVAPVVPLIGRPNSGKSSLYNRLTGRDAKVGNFPGITVDILEGDVALPDGRTATIVDLPGLYSIESIVDPTTDEGVARAFLDCLSASRPLLLVQVVDATQLALGLRLTYELANKNFPLLVVVTQRDVLEAEGRLLDSAALEAILGLPVLVVSARDPTARDAVLAAVATHLRCPQFARRSPTWDPSTAAGSVLRDAPTATLAAQRRRTLTARTDAWLLHPILGPVLFLGLMSLLFAAVFLVADPATDLLDRAVELARRGLARWLGTGMLTSFLSGGILGGAGTVLAFMPQIVVLTIAMELLDATGYLARGAFLLDRLLRLLGLSGRSFVPLLLGHACAVPAITSTRIVRDPRERLTTILVLPLMTCAGKIPTYALLIGTFFAAKGASVRALLFVGIYFAGILCGLFASLLLRRSATRGKALPLVLEMPAYRVPQAKVVAQKAWQAATRFLRDVGSVIVVVSAILWALLTIPMPGALARGAGSPPRPIEASLAAGVGRAVEPLTRPLGFDWRINVALIGSFGARELMVGTLGVIFGTEDAEHDPAPLSRRMREARNLDGSPKYTTRTALALLAFFMLACQCMSTASAVRRETKTLRWPAFLLAYTYATAYVAALVVYQLGGLLGLT